MFATRISSIVACKPSLLLRMCGVSAWNREVIGCREVVGYGCNGQPIYVDRPDYPFPAIRFLADNPYLQVN